MPYGKKKTGAKPSAVGVNLRRLRHAAGLSQQELGTKAGRDRVTIAYLETGRSQDADGSTLTALAEALGVELEDLTGDPHAGSPVEKHIAAFQKSAWAASRKPSDDDLKWLRSLSAKFWVGFQPTPEGMFKLLEARRVAQAEANH